MLHIVMLLVILALMWSLEKIIRYAIEVGNIYSTARAPAIAKYLASPEFDVLVKKTRGWQMKIICTIIPFGVLATSVTVAMWMAYVTETTVSQEFSIGAAVGISYALVLLFTIPNPGWLVMFRSVLIRAQSRVHLNIIANRLLEIAETITAAGEPTTDEDKAAYQLLVYEAEYLTSAAEVLQESLTGSERVGSAK